MAFGCAQNVEDSARGPPSQMFVVGKHT